MSTDLLVVIGATGTQGASVINHARKQHPQLAIRGITRKTTSPAATALQSQNVELVQGSLEDAASLAAAFKGATHIFAMTDYWALMLSHLKSGGHADPFTAAYNDELTQGKNIVAAVRQNSATLKHLIFSSLPSPDTISGGKYKQLYHFEAKAAIEALIKADKQLADKTTIVWAGYYMENIVRWDLSDYLRPRKDPETGGYVLATPSHPDTKLDLLATEDDFGKYGKPTSPLIKWFSWSAELTCELVAPLLSSAPTSTPILASSESLTFPAITAVLSRRLGVPITYRQRSFGEMKEKYGGFGEVFEEMYGYFDGWGFCGDVLRDGAREMGLQGKLTGFEEFVKGKEWQGFLVEGEEGAA